MCSADGKIRLTTLELSCLLLKQQVVTSTGCIIKDVHLACLEVRDLPTRSTREPLSPRESEGALVRGGHSTSQQLGPVALMPYCSPVPTELPFLWDWLDVNFSSFCYNHLALTWLQDFEIILFVLQKFYTYMNVYIRLFIVYGANIYIVLNSLYDFPFIFHVYFRNLESTVVKSDYS